MAHRDDIFIDDFEAFPGFVAIAERSTGLRRLRIQPLDGSAERYVESDEPDSTAWLADNAEQATTKLRYGFTSLRTPVSTFEVDMQTGERVLLKQQAGSRRLRRRALRHRAPLPRRPATAPRCRSRSLYRKGFAPDGKAPLLLEAYGSYGYSSDPYFDSDVLSLVDRGFVYAIAHVRGGQEMGRALVRGRQAPAGRRTPSSTSSTSPRAWSRGATPPATASSRWAAAPAAC